MLHCYYKKELAATIIALLVLLNTGYAALRDTVQVVNNGMVTGTVIDQDAQPLKGVAVAVKNTALLVNTDAEGNFEIKATAGDILVFKYANYNTRELSVKQDSKLVVKLLETYLRSPDTVNVLYGKAAASGLLGAIASVYTNQLTTTPTSLYTYALTGQLAGLFTLQFSGFTTPLTNSLTSESGNVNQASHNLVATDNSEIALFLRGQRPVSIVNGIQREISSLDPESIESVSVLKDALSSILLGTNSSRGILLVNTKRAEIGKPRISFTAQTGLQQSLGVAGNVLPSYQWAYLYNEALLNDGRAPVFKKEDIAAYRDQTDPTGHPDVNWFKTILNDQSAIRNYKLNISGGTPVTRYQLSLSYLNQGGIFKTSPDVPYNTNNNLNRYLLNTTVNVNVTKNLNVDLQMFGRIQESLQPGGGISNILKALYTTPSNAYPIYNPNKSFGGSNAGGTTGPFVNNLLALSQRSGYLKNTSKDVLVNLDLNYDLNSALKGLTAVARGNISIQSINLLDRSLINTSYLYNAKDQTYATVNSPRAQSNKYVNSFTSRYVFAQGALNYNRAFGKHAVSGMLMIDMRNTTLNYDLSALTTNRAFKGGYNFDEKYFAEIAVNNSGYNRYAPGFQNAWYYAAGLGWQMAKENFIKDNIDWINSWKWRVTYGRTGNNNVDDYQYFGYRQTYSQTIKGYAVGVNKNLVFSFNEDALANASIRAEKGNKLNFGTDISLLKDHLTIVADYYHDKYSDLLGIRGKSLLLIGANPPNVTEGNLTFAGNGSIYPVENIGRSLYHGGELTLTYKNNIRNFNYFISANGAIQASKILFTDEQFRPNSFNYRTGKPINSIFGYKALGLFQSAEEAANSPTILGYNAQAGDIKYADIGGSTTNEDGSPKPDGVIDRFDEMAIGNTRPLMFYGVSLGFNYKGFSVSVLLQGVTNRDIYESPAMLNGFAGLTGTGGAPYGQAYESAVGRWTEETAATATSPRVSISNLNNNQQSSFYIRSGNYFRIKNAEIGYNLPYSLTSRLNIAGIRVFANGENLFTITGYKGFDPEVYPNNRPGAFPYPIQRVFNAGLSIRL